MASIPRARHLLTRGLGLRKAYQIELTPSKQATAAGYSHPVYVDAYHDGEEEILRAGPIDFYDYLFSGNGQKADWTQSDCIILIEKITTHIMMNNGAVHKHLLDAINDAKQAIYLDRQDIEAAYPAHFSHTSKWSSSWFFKFPPYDPSILNYTANGPTLEN